MSRLEEPKKTVPMEYFQIKSKDLEEDECEVDQEITRSKVAQKHIINTIDKTAPDETSPID